MREVLRIPQIRARSDVSVQCREVAPIGQPGITAVFQLVASILAGVNGHARAKSAIERCHSASDLRVAPRTLRHFRIFFFTKCKRYMRKHLKNLYKRCTCFYYLAMAQRPPVKKTSAYKERSLNSSPHSIWFVMSQALSALGTASRQSLFQGYGYSFVC